MQNITLKLSQASASLLHSLLKQVFTNYKEGVLVECKDFELLLILCSLKDLYARLGRAIQFDYHRHKNFRLKPQESISLYCLISYDIIKGANTWQKNVLTVLVLQLHKDALSEGISLKLPNN